MAKVSASVRIKSVDSGFARLLENVYRGEKPRIHVGIMAKDGAKPHGEDEITVAEIAAIHEYGLGDAVERSFLRAWFGKHQDQVREALRRQTALVIEGKLDRYNALAQMGAWIAGEIQRYISANQVKPPTSAETNERKGSTTTLVDDGILKSAISFSVVGVKRPVPPKPVKLTGFRSKKAVAARKKLKRQVVRRAKAVQRRAKAVQRQVKRQSRNVNRAVKKVIAPKKKKRGLRKRKS